MESLRGHIYLNGEMLPFEMRLDAGVIESLEIGESGEVRKGEYLALPPLGNAHTHIGDAFIQEEIFGDIMDVVAPPDGLKHRRLAEAGQEEIMDGMLRALENMYGSGVRTFMDFREQGVEGVRLLRKALASFNDITVMSGLPPISARILGRPAEGDDMDELLGISNGLGISSISDHDTDYLRELRDEAERHGKLFGLHVSERVREDIDTVLELRPDIAVHMNEATDEDMERIAEAGIPVVVCPSSNMFFGKVPPVKRLLSAGVTVTLGTDNLMLNPPSIIREMGVLNLAARLGRTPLSCKEVVKIGVANTRRFLGMEEWMPREGDAWDGVLLHGKYANPWKAAVEWSFTAPL